MSVELDTVVDSKLFKTQTDGLSGNGSLKYVDGVLTWVADVVTPEPAYSSLAAPSTSILSLIAGDASDSADYTDFTAPSMWEAGVSRNFVQSGVSGSLTTQLAGVYRLTFWTDISSSVAATLFSFRYDINGTQSTQKLQTTAKDAGDLQNISATGLVSLTQGSTVKVKIVADKTCSATVVGGGIVLEKIDN